MNRNISTHRFFTQETQRAFYERVKGYVSKEESFVDRLATIRKQTGHLDLARMDLGQNREGCAPEVREYWRTLGTREPPWDYLSAYPEIHGMELQGALAQLHGIRPEWILFSAGLEQMIAMVAATFLENRDRFLTTDPGFFLFDEYSRRQGGSPLILPLEEEDDFSWTSRTTGDYEQVLRRLQPKLIWIANPNNPTGRLMNLSQIEEVVALAEENLAIIVVDEAYGEYTDPDSGVSSASALLGNYRNLIVLRSFSKAYGLAGIRIGYAMTNNAEINIALRMHRPNYPIARMSYDLAKLAVRHITYLTEVRRKVEEQKAFIGAELAGCSRIQWLPGDSSLGLLRVQGLTSEALLDRLARKGIIVSPIWGEGTATQHYVRVNQGTAAENGRFVSGVQSLV